MKTRPKRLKKQTPDIWDLWEAKGFTLPNDDELCRLSRGEPVETSEKPERQLELFPIGGRLVPVDAYAEINSAHRHDTTAIGVSAGKGGKDPCYRGIGSFRPSRPN